MPPLYCVDDVFFYSSSVDCFYQERVLGVCQMLFCSLDFVDEMAGHVSLSFDSLIHVFLLTFPSCVQPGCPCCTWGTLVEVQLVVSILGKSPPPAFTPSPGSAGLVESLGHDLPGHLLLR